jgi:hypothetical protein
VVATGVEDGDKFAVEHLEARFLKACDMENFEKVYL